LLKILSRITTPTAGNVELYGRVASLLEVGTGFHPELTGRENIFLNGAILGMSKAEIKGKFGEIVAFAEIEKFIDTPVKHYSSGMYVRLAFAVAAHLEPDILIVDEVLAVGDAQFQKKCLGKMEYVAKEGRTVLFVSHNMGAIIALCSRALLLDSAMLKCSGPVREVVGEYLNRGRSENLVWKPDAATGPFRYKTVSVMSGCGGTSHPFMGDEPINILFDYIVAGPLPPGRLALKLLNHEGITVLTASATDVSSTLNKSWAMGGHLDTCVVPGHLLAPGKYSLTISEPVEDGTNRIHENIITFVVSEHGSLWSRDKREGIITPLLKWSSQGIVNE
jgi:lipopolysaccharide transport system ATP-binding protein